MFSICGRILFSERVLFRVWVILIRVFNLICGVVVIWVWWLFDDIFSFDMIVEELFVFLFLIVI